MRAAARRISFILLIVCQAVSQSLSAQSSDFVYGMVINSSTSQGIPFTRINLKSNHISVYSNAEGTFRLINNPVFQSDSLIITCLGYTKSAIAFSSLRAHSIYKIFLNPSKSGDSKVKVAAGNEKLTSLAIIRRAIGNINSKYPNSLFNYISYYRDYQRTDTNYFNLNEAIVETIDSGFTRDSRENVYRLMDFRRNSDFPRMNLFPGGTDPDSTEINFTDKLIPILIRRGQYGHELLTLIAYDPIRNFNKPTFSLIQRFSENFIGNHNFSPPSEIRFDNVMLYKITFNGKSSIVGDSLLLTGSLYIQQDDYSIHKLEYSCYNQSVRKGLKKLFDFVIEYGKNGKSDSPMYLKYISFGRHFTVFDADDKTYFRLIESYWDTYNNINPTLAIRFNNKIDPEIARQKENYIALIGNKAISIKGIQVVGEKLYLRFNAKDINGLTDSCKVYIKIIKDINGNVIDKRKPFEIDQYRELFVEEINPEHISGQSPLQNLQSDKDTIPALQGKTRYWMNTPLKISDPLIQNPK
jgi:hypothetical protein